MYQRLIKFPGRSAFVFGPRGVGKSTWVNSLLPNAKAYDLLDTRLYLDLTRDPNAFYRALNQRPRGEWVVVDEIQRVPDLLNEIHRLIENPKLNFLMTGSSARKLRRSGVNLLAGRAINRQMFPLVSAELGNDFELDRALRYGSLPMATQDEHVVEYLLAYAQTYLAEEIFQESLVRHAGNFSRFLEVAARQNGQTVNPNGIARDVGVSRPTVVNHFQILFDTLMGTWLSAWKLKSSIRQQQQSKFYFFDCGVLRALTHRVAFPPIDEELGPLLETLIHNEIRAFLEYSGLYYRLHYWRTYDGAEIDFLVPVSDGYVAIEVKNSRSWKNQFNRGFRRFVSQVDPSINVKCIGIYRGPQEEHWDDVYVTPATKFLTMLWDHEIIA